MDEIEELMEALEHSKHKTTLVEGPNDTKALEKLGFTDVVEINGPLYKVVERLQGAKEIVILTDLDKAGKKLYQYFYHELTTRGVRIDNRARVALFKTPVRQVEGLANFLDRR